MNKDTKEREKGRIRIQRRERLNKETRRVNKKIRRERELSEGEEESEEIRR